MFLVHLGIILGYAASKEGKLSNPKKISAIVHMPTLKTPKDIHVFNFMAQYYKCFIKHFAFIMAPNTKLLW
jgi:primosomal protein N'